MEWEQTGLFVESLSVLVFQEKSVFSTMWNEMDGMYTNYTCGMVSHLLWHCKTFEACNACPSTDLACLTVCEFSVSMYCADC